MQSRAIWISDSQVKRCYLCSNTFTFFNRKHHCRVCGRVFCGNCTVMNQPIPHTWENAKSPPSTMTNMIGWAWQKMYSSEEHMIVGSPSQYEYVPSSTLHEDSQEMTEKRVCHSCSQDVRVRIDHKDLYTIFLLLGDFGVGPKEWKCILSIPGANVWKKVCALLSQQWTKVTTIMPYQRASKSQRKLLHYMRRYLSPQHIGFFLLPDFALAVAVGKNVTCFRLRRANNMARLSIS